MIRATEIHPQIREVAAANRLVVFCGSGVSAEANRPDWRTLVRGLIRECSSSADATFIASLDKILPADISSAFEGPLLKLVPWLLRTHFSNSPERQQAEYFDALRRGLEPDSGIAHCPAHAAILQLAKYVITTNFDDCFESAGQSSDAIWGSVRVPTDAWKPIQDKQIYHLHGRIDRPESILFDLDQYRQGYSVSGEPSKFMSEVFNNKDNTFLLLGTSLDDEYVLSEFCACRDLRRHFVLCREDERDIFELLGFTVVSYALSPNGDANNYPGFQNTLIAWSQQIRGAGAPRGVQLETK